MRADETTLDLTGGPDRFRNLGALHDETAADDPDRVALIDGATGETVSYGVLAERIAAAGNALADLGAGIGDRVALLFPNELAFVYTFFGACRIGAVPVPVNIQVSQETLDAVVGDSDARLVATSADPETLDHATQTAARVDGVRMVAVAADDPMVEIDGVEAASLTAAMTAADTTLDPAAVGPDDPAMQPYTSGSTGQPKGVTISHRNAHYEITTIHRVHFLDADDRVIVAGPLYHKNAMVGGVKPMLAVGGSVVVMPGFDADEVIAAIDEYAVTYIRGVPAMYKILVNATEALAKHDVSSIEWAVSGSASLPEALIEDVRRTFGCAMGEAYGLTETGGPVTLSPRWGPRKLGSCGLALPGIDLRIVDPDTLDELPAGETGELVVSSPANGGYYGRPDEEAAAFFERDGRRFLRTDDLAHVDKQGYVYVVGRLDDMMIVGGENVYPAEVEGLLSTHPAVRDVCVVPAPHGVKGEAPVAFVVADGVTEEELKEFALDNGPAYAHPRRVFFVEELPLAGTGKIDRDALEASARERLGDPL